MNTLIENSFHYEWDSAYSWLEDKYLRDVDPRIRNLLATLDGDDIQCEYQSEMIEDGFYDLLFDETCAVCDKPVGKDIDALAGEGYQCPECDFVYHLNCDESKLSNGVRYCSECAKEQDE